MVLASERGTRMLNEIRDATFGVIRPLSASWDTQDKVKLFRFDYGLSFWLYKALGPRF